MNHKSRGGIDRHSSSHESFSDHDDWHRDSPHRHGRLGRHGRRLFSYGELRLLLLAMLAEQPSHGYELIKVIEERFGGTYTPSPGVIYPTLAWLDDMDYAVIETEEAGRKRYRITDEGKSFLDANRAAADKLLSRTGPAGSGQPPAPVVRAMENLKFAIRLRLKEGHLDQATAEKIAAALDAAAQTVERS